MDKAREFIKKHKKAAIALTVVILLICTVYGYLHSKYEMMQITEGVEENAAPEVKDEEQVIAEKEMAEKAETLEEAEVVEATVETITDSGVINVLLIGSDERSKAFKSNARGDTCMLLSVNKGTGKVHLISFERAMGMPILYGQYRGQYDWLTHTFRYGGAAMMTREIRDSFKIDVRKYVRVNIRIFMQLVDSVGGVDIELTEAEADNINHPEGTFTAGHIRGMKVEDEVQQDLVPGVNHLNGATAMLYARLRSIDDDWHRVQRQRNVITAAVENLRHLSPAELDAFLNDILPMIQTNLTEADIAELLLLAPKIVQADFEQMTIPLARTYGIMTGMEGRAMYAVDFDTNAQVLQDVLYNNADAESIIEYYRGLAVPTYRRRQGSSSGGSTGGASGSGSGNRRRPASRPQSPQASTEVIVDPETGIEVHTTTNPETGEVVTEAVDPSTGLTVVTATDPATGVTTTWAVDPNTGENVITSVTQDGEVIGGSVFDSDELPADPGTLPVIPAPAEVPVVPDPAAAGGDAAPVPVPGQDGAAVPAVPVPDQGGAAVPVEPVPDQGGAAVPAEPAPEQGADAGTPDNSSFLINPDNGLVVDTNTGVWYDPSTGLPIDLPAQ